jgi:hypothetical protein
MGGDKVGMIQRFPVLAWYARKFEEYLCLPDTRLMIIGYGFRDEHINRAICASVERGLKIFNVSPEGADHARMLDPTNGAAIKGPKTSLEDAFERGLIGASRRFLSETFAGDDAEWEKINRFFAE